MNTENARKYAKLLALTGWDPALQSILAGVVHDLNGRVTSLGAVLQLAEIGGELPHGVASEEERLRQLSEDIQLLLGDLSERRTPVLPADLVDRAGRLVARARGAFSGSVRLQVLDVASVPPVLVQEAAMVRAVATLFLGLSDAEGQDIEVEVSGHEDEALVRVRNRTLADPTQGVALQELLELEGGTLTVDSNGLEIRLPSLTRSRAAGL